MTIRRYCDRCDIELDRDYVSQRYQPVLEGFAVEIMVRCGLPEKITWNGGQMCLSCVQAIVNEGVER